MVDPIQAGQLLESECAALDGAELEQLRRFQREVNRSADYAEGPAVSVRALVESDETFGCGAGGNTILYVDPAGNLQPCGFMSVSTGNVVDEPFDVAFERMRRLFPHPVACGGVCPANLLREDLLAAYRRHGELPVPYEQTRQLCARFTDAPLPRLY